MRRILIVVGILLIPLVPIVLVVTGVIGSKPTSVSPVKLTVWGTIDSSKAFSGVFARYALSRPYAKVSYQKVAAEDYYDQLISAWAAGTGPDVFFVPQSWIGAMEQYAVPLPSNIGVPRVLGGRGLFGTSTEVVNLAQAAPTVSSLREDYIDGVSSDVVRENKIWGLPLAMDTLVLYSNKDILNDAQIFTPARTWSELLQQIDQNRLTVTDDQDNLVRSAVAIGNIENVPHATDLLTLLLLQNGVPAAQTGGSVNLTQEKAQTAVDFFLSFSNQRKTSYSWNATQPNALDAFLSGKLAYYFGTYADRAAIEKGSINWSVTPMLHLSTEGDSDAASGQTRVISPAIYEVAMVAKASELQNRSTNAWNLVNFMADASVVETYLSASNRLAARRAILEKQKDSSTRGVYATQLLTAKNWYRGRGGPQLPAQLANMVQSVQTNQSPLADALRLLSEQINAGL